MNKELEEGIQPNLDFTKFEKIITCGEKLIPAITQDIDSKEVLILGYINESALNHSLKNQIATFWSTSRNELWIKGTTSADILDLVEIRVNCEQNAVLYLVKLRGKGACHTKNQAGNSRFTCFYRKLKQDVLEFIEP